MFEKGRDMTERVLVPLDGMRLPGRAFVCIEGITQVSPVQPTMLGPSVPQEYLDRPLREYLEDKTRELKGMGVKASPVFVRGGHANAPLDFAESGGAAVFVISIHGPYRVSSI